MRWFKGKVENKKNFGKDEYLRGGRGRGYKVVIREEWGELGEK